MKPVIAFTMGDPGGIGPEVVVASTRDARVRRACDPLFIGSRSILARSGWTPVLGPLLDPGVECGPVLGRPTAAGGRASFEAVRLAVRLAARRLVGAVMTAPISKQAWSMAGAGYTDHTGYLEEATGAQGAMMLLAGRLRTVLVTRHMPLRDVARRLTSGAVEHAATMADKALRRLGIRAPRLALCALNPHAGEGGLLGEEERRVLAPAAARLRRRGIRARGPVPADAAWGRHAAGAYDGLVTLYHDQALIPLKTADPYGVVNWTVGLPVVRTSPGHGTAFDIAGTGRADARATIEAALLAARLCSRN